MADNSLPYSAWASYFTIWCGHRESDESWTIVEIDSYSHNIRGIYCAAVGDHVWVQESGHELYYSDDGGATWAVITPSHTGYNPGRIHACTIDGITRLVSMTRWMSDTSKVQVKLLDDNGSSWTSRVRTLPGWTDPIGQAGFEMDVNGVLHFAFAYDRERIYYTRSEDWGDTWLAPVQTHERVNFPGAEDQPTYAYRSVPVILARDGKVAISSPHDLASYRYNWEPPFSATWDRGGIVTNVSLDGGLTWEGQQMWPPSGSGYLYAHPTAVCCLAASDGDLYIGFLLYTWTPDTGYPGSSYSEVEISKQTAWTGAPGHYAAVASPGWGAYAGARAFSSDDPLMMFATHRQFGPSPQGAYEIFDGVSEWVYVHDMDSEQQETILMQVAYPGPALVTVVPEAYTYFF